MSKTYKRVLEDKVILYKLNEKGKHLTIVRSKDNEHIETIKTWINNGSIYKKIHKTFPQESIKEYYKDNKFHRDNGKPAYKLECFKYRADIYHDKWYKDGKLHNLSGPSVVYIEDLFHDENDPHYYKEDEYYIDGVKLKKSDYENVIKKMNQDILTSHLLDCTPICKDACGIISTYVY